MGNRFMDRWKKKEEPEQPSIVEKIKNVGKPQENLKDQINTVIQRIDTQTQKLDIAAKRLEARDQDIFGKVVKAFAQRDSARANMLATELSEVRKIEKVVTQASLAMQSVSMRLNTVSAMGDIVTVLAPARGVISSIGSEMCNIFPEASQELGSIGSILSDICGSTSQGAEININSGRVDPEAEAILREAESEAEKKLRNQLPEVSKASAAENLTSLEA